ncbi:hypothetical protein [Aureibaculum conchae]|uniref:hypothetical protein n=1 Tax=Aureibaculum sp. 2308TA14-22 TaxID=3108392 RepID=UPI003390B541
MKNLKKIVSVLTILTLTFFVPAILNSSNLTSKVAPFDKTGGAYLTIAGKFGGDISKQEIEDNYKLGVEGCAKGSKITQFTIHIKATGKTITVKEDTDTLNSKILSHLKDLKKGDTFTFKNVKAKLPSGSNVDVVSRTFTIV